MRWQNCAVPAYVECTAVSGAGVAYHVYQYGENMRQTVKETVELLKESTEKRFFYAEGRTTS